MLARSIREQTFMNCAHRNILAVLMTVATLSAQAATITYEFVINWVDGDLVGSSSSGAVTIDAALALPGASYRRPDLLTDFQFSVRGQDFTLQDVTSGYLSFDDKAQLQALGVGTDCKPGVCYVYSGQPASFAISYFAAYAPDTFSASNGNPAGFTVNGKGAFSIASSVPEPSVWCLTMLGLVGMAAVLRRSLFASHQAVNEG